MEMEILLPQEFLAGGAASGTTDVP